MKRIVLVNFVSAEIRPLVDNFDIGNSTALLYLKHFAARDEEVARNCRIEIEVIHEEKSDDEIIEQWRAEPPALVGFSCYIWNVQRTLAFCRRLNEALPDVKTVLGGPEVWDPATTLRRNPQIDIVIVGEGELPFLDLLGRLAAGNCDFKGIPGVSGRAGGLIFIDETFRETDPADLPVILTPENLIGVEGEVLIETSRGCVNRCRYCAIGSAKKRFFPLERVEAEIQAALSNPGTRRLIFSDSAIDENSRRFIDLLTLLAKHNKRRVHIGAFLMMRKLDPETIDLMKRANLRSVMVGVETVDPFLLMDIGRRSMQADRLEMIKPLLDDPFFAVRVLMIYIIPGDTLENFFESVRLCMEKGIVNFDCSRCRILPGTWFYRNSAREKISFDPEPPHYLMSSKNFGRRELEIAEQFVINLKMLLRFIPPSFMPIMKMFNLDLVDIAADIHLRCPSWLENLKVQRFHDTDVRILPDPKLIDTLGEYWLKAAPGADKISVKGVRETLLFGYFKKDLESFEASGDVPKLPVEDSRRAIVHDYRIHTFEHNIPALLQMARGELFEPQNEETTLYFFKKPGNHEAEVMAPENKNLLVNLLDHLQNSGSLGEAYEKLSVKYAKLKKESFDKYIAFLQDAGALRLV